MRMIFGLYLCFFSLSSFADVEPEVFQDRPSGLEFRFAGSYHDDAAHWDSVLRACGELFGSEWQLAAIPMVEAAPRVFGDPGADLEALIQFLVRVAARVIKAHLPGSNGQAMYFKHTDWGFWFFKNDSVYMRLTSPDSFEDVYCARRIQ